MTGHREGRLFRGREGLRELEASWRLLQARVPDARFIHHYAWYLSYVESGIPDDDRVVFVRVCDDGEPVAIFPLQRTLMHRLHLTLRGWEILWPGDMGICDFVFAKTEDNRLLLAWLIRYLREQVRPGWDVLRLQDTLDDSCARYSLVRSRPPLSVTYKHHVSKHINCDADYETVMGRVTTAFRRNVRRQRKKMLELGPMEFRFVSEPRELTDALRHFLEVEATSWKGDSGTKSAILLDEQRTRFYRTLVDEFSKTGACAINLVLLNGQCVAGQVGVIVGDTLYLLKIAYRDEHRALGPGNVLLDEVIRHACQGGSIRRISFVTGAAWNDRWSPECLDVYETYVYNTTLPGLAAYVMEEAKNQGRRLKHWVEARRASGAGPTRSDEGQPEGADPVERSRP